jgi:hypothetical protein
MHLPYSDSPSDDQALLTVSEVAARLRVQSSWVYAHADSLGAVRVGRYLRFVWNRVMENLNRNPQKG